MKLKNYNFYDTENVEQLKIFYETIENNISDKDFFLYFLGHNFNAVTKNLDSSVEES